MRIPKMLGALVGTLLIGSSSAAPIFNSTAHNATYNNATASATYFQTDAAQWVSDTQLCGTASREHTGYINVGNLNNTDKLNMAFWLFQGTEHQEHLPLYIIIGGEAGVPVTQSVFGPAGPCAENLPNNVEDPSAMGFDAGKIDQGKHGFQRWAHTLYIETPIGLGFSYAEGTAVADQSEEEYLYTFLQRFYEVFPEYEERRVVLQSFDLGAKTATKLTKTILDHNKAIEKGQSQNLTVNLDSIILLSPYLDPAMQVSYIPKVSRKNPEGEPWLSKSKAKIFKMFFAQWLAECFGRDYRTKDLKNPDRELSSCNKKQRMDRFEELWHGITEGYDTKDGRYPNIDPFDLRDVRQERMSEFLYHRVRKGGLEGWLQDRSNQRKIGFAPFADAGLNYTSFNRPMVDNVLKTTFFDSARGGLNDAMQNDVKVVVIGGDMDAVTSWISLFSVIFKTRGIGNFIHADLELFNDSATKGDTYPVHPTYLGDAALKDRLWAKTGSKVQYFLVTDLGHDIEKQDPGLFHDLAMYATWPRPSEEQLRGAQVFAPGREPVEDSTTPFEINWPANHPYQEHEPQVLDVHDDIWQKRSTLAKRRAPKQGDNHAEEMRKIQKEAQGSEAETLPEEGPLEQLYQGVSRVADPEDSPVTIDGVEGPGAGSLHLSDFPDYYDEELSEVDFFPESEEDGDGSFSDEPGPRDSSPEVALDDTSSGSALDDASPEAEDGQENHVQGWLDDVADAESRPLPESGSQQSANFEPEAELRELMREYRTNPDVRDGRTLQEFLQEHSDYSPMPSQFDESLVDEFESGESSDKDVKSGEDKEHSESDKDSDKGAESKKESGEDAESDEESNDNAKSGEESDGESKSDEEPEGDSESEEVFEEDEDSSDQHKTKQPAQQNRDSDLKTSESNSQAEVEYEDYDADSFNSEEEYDEDQEMIDEANRKQDPNRYQDDGDFDTESYESDEVYDEVDHDENPMDKEFVEPRPDEWADLRESSRKALGELGYQKLGGNSFTSDQVEELMNHDRPINDISDLTTAGENRIQNWAEDVDKSIPDVPEVASPDLGSLVDIATPDLSLPNLPSVPLPIPGGAAVPASLAAGSAAGSAGGGVANGIGAGLAGAGSVAGGIAGGIGAGLGGLFGAGGDDDDEVNHHHHHHHNYDTHHHHEDNSVHHKDGGDDKNHGHKTKDKNAGTDKPSDKDKDGGKKDGKKKDDDKKYSGTDKESGNKTQDMKDQPEAKGQDDQSKDQSKEKPEPEVKNMVEGDEDGDGDNDKHDKKLRKQAKKQFKSKAKEIKKQASDEDDEAKDKLDEAKDKAKDAKKSLKEANKDAKKAMKVVPDAEADAKKAFKNAKKKAQGAKKSANKVMKKIQKAAEAEVAAQKAIEEAMEGAVGEAALAKLEMEVALNVEKELKEEAKEANENTANAKNAKAKYEAELERAAKLAKAKDDYDDALTKGTIAIEDVIAAEEAAVKAEEEAKRRAEELARQKASLENIPVGAAGTSQTSNGVVAQ